MLLLLLLLLREQLRAGKRTKNAKCSVPNRMF
jgi:hypothetical protein